MFATVSPSKCYLVNQLGDADGKDIHTSLHAASPGTSEMAFFIYSSYDLDKC